MAEGEVPKLGVRLQNLVAVRGRHWHGLVVFGHDDLLARRKCAGLKGG